MDWERQEWSAWVCVEICCTNCDATRAVYKAAKNLSHEKQFFMAIKHLFKELHTYIGRTGYRSDASTQHIHPLQRYAADVIVLCLRWMSIGRQTACNIV